MNQAGLGWAIGTSLLAVVACGATDQPSNGTAGGAGQSSSRAGAGPTGSAGSGTNSAGSAGSAGAETSDGTAGTSSSAGSAGQADQSGYHGAVQAGWTDNGDQFYTSASATFSVPGQPAGRSCTLEVIGTCRVNTCVESTRPLMVPQAGTITLSNGDMFNATLMPNGDGGYSAHSESHVLLPGDDNITINASGGDVPAFSSTFIQPLTLLITSPIASSTGDLAWSRNADLPLKWDRGVPKVQLLVEGGANLGVTVDCLFPSEAGEASIPAAVLKQLPPATTLFVYTFKVQSITAGKYAIDLKAFASAMDPDKKRGIRVTVQ